ncbi:MAG: HlyD family type I secretion periplasmic adaptor subunit [Rhodocyclales bacterium]|nr:HlyD family type I secretion periplasmic adaptor subunit [Rhodocyclales bacterium]
MTTSLASVESDPPFSRSDTEKELHGAVRLASIALFVTFGIGGLWSVLAPLSGAVIAQGVIKVESSAQLVQHMDGGVVRRILVKDGQRVAAGQPVVELEDTEASASLAIVNSQLDAEVAKLARLQAEIDNVPRIRFPESLTARKSNTDVNRILQREEDHFLARNAQLREQLEKLQEQKRQAEAEIASVDRQVSAADQSLKYLRDQETSYAGLVEKNFVAPVRMLDARRQVSEKEEKKFEYEALRSQARQKLADVQLRLGQIHTGRYADNSRDMVETQSRILNLQERQLPFKDSLKKRILSAPASGVVNAVRVHTEGGVIAPREPILEITPDTSGLIAEVRISPADVDEVRPGQEVEVEFSGMNRRVTSLVKGRVQVVSSDLITDPANAQLKYFVVRVELTPATPLSFEPRPGMPVAAYVKTRDRTPLEIWLDPLIGGIRKSLRET